MSSSSLYNVIQFMVGFYVIEKCACSIGNEFNIVCKTYSVKQHFHSTWHCCKNGNVTIAFINVNT